MGLVRTIYYCLKLRHNDKQHVGRIKRIQRRNLMKAVRYAKARSPYFKELYKDVDPDSPDFSVRALPPVTKDDLMENFDSVVTDPRLSLKEVREWTRDREKLGRMFKRKFIVTHTSGTTGMPAYFVYSRKEWDWIQALSVTRGIRYKPSFIDFWRHAGWVLFHRTRVALISVLGGHFVTYLLFLITPGMAKKLSRFEFLSVIKPVPELVARLNQLDPHVLHCYPTMLEVLAHEQLEGRMHIKPWLISSSSEPLTPMARRRIERAFPKSPIYETYGTTEGITLASECHQHSAMHVNTDHYIIESVKDDGSPVEPGQPGDKVYLSCLFMRTMPLLRYELTDVTIPLAEPCDCGLPFPLLKVRGRTDDIFWVYDQQKQPVALPPIPFEAMLLEIDGMRQYQLVQEERNRLMVYFRPNPGVDPAQVHDQIRKQFDRFLNEKQLADCVQVGIQQVEEIQRDPKSGKIRQIFSKVERLYLPGVPLGERRSGEDRRLAKDKVLQGERRSRQRRTDEEEEGEDK
jgi:phenylacetate-coenzyme A ligase PaaK-like adenylate-forming protein